MGYRDDTYVKGHEKEENNLISTSIINAMQQDLGKIKLEEASALDEDRQKLAAKACIMALTNNSKKLEARTK